MSFINAYVKYIFGRTIGADQAARAMSGSNGQRVSENVVVTTSRKMKGPQRNGHFSYHVINKAGSAPVGNLTVWYSNLPDPDETSDADWVQDTAIPSLDLSVVANTFPNIGNVNAEHVRFKVTRTSGTIDLIIVARVEGVEV